MRGKVGGPTIEAVARILPADEEALAERALERKHGWMMRIGSFLSKLRGDRVEGVYLEIVPVEEEEKCFIISGQREFLENFNVFFIHKV